MTCPRCGTTCGGYMECPPVCAEPECWGVPEIDSNGCANHPQHVLPGPSVADQVLAELERATVKFPTWPTDPLHALGVLHEEVGELSKEVLQLVYEPHKTSPAKVREEAIQAAAMALRFAMSLDTYEYAPGPQHAQP